MIDQRDYMADLKTLCIFLGPLGNLTTLTAGALVLHPDCQVLNHGAQYLWEARGCNFLADWTDANVRRFVGEAIKVSCTSGISSYAGGSVLVSHLFKGSLGQHLYIERYGSQVLPDRIRCLVWKDPMEVENYIFDYGVQVAQLFERDGGLLRFLLPIRHPLDTAVSLVNSSNWAKYRDTKREFSNVVREVIYDIRRFLELEREYPDRCFHFVQDEVDESMLLSLAAFLGLELDGRWVADVLKLWQVRESYDLPERTRRWHEITLSLVLHEFPDVVAKLVALSEAPGTRPLPELA